MCRAREPFQASLLADRRSARVVRQSLVGTPVLLAAAAEKNMTQKGSERGGSADGSRNRPNATREAKHDKVLGDELDDSFPASDPATSTQPMAKEPPPPKPRDSERRNPDGSIDESKER